MRARYDIVVIGAGPAGLGFACLANDLGLDVAVVETEREEALAAPPPDGRDIALTHRSVRTLDALGAWRALPAGEIAPIRRATVRNGTSGDLLNLERDGMGHEALGYLVPNHIIRATLFRQARARAKIDLLPGRRVTGIDLGDTEAETLLASGELLRAALVVAADSRFSEMRRKAGIGADMRDFGRICIVCRMRHEKPHDATAYEWFDYDRTIAILPFNNRESSVVITLAAHAASGVMRMPAGLFSADVERRFASQWGAMELTGVRHAYPLVAVYADRFHAHRFALVGDAAVGMHPVTAHGFNFGLRGAATLAREVGKAHETGRDIGSDSVLDTYSREHRRATYPLYLATNAIVGLYTDHRLPARIARDALLRIGNGLTPFRDYMIHKLTEMDEPRQLV